MVNANDVFWWILAVFIEPFRGRPLEQGRDQLQISRRELEIAQAYTGGKTYREIANDLNIAPATVRTHINNIYRKLEVSSKIELLHRIQTQDAPLPSRPSLSTKKASLYVGGLAVVSAVAALLYGQERPLASAISPLPELRTLALVPFHHDGNDIARDTMVSELVAGLSAHTEVFVVRPSDLKRESAPQDYARTLSHGIDVRYVLYGETADGDQGFTVAAKLYDGWQEAVIWKEELQSAQRNSLALRLALLNSLAQTLVLPAKNNDPARCMEMVEHDAPLSAEGSGEKLYRFETRPLYCQSARSGPR